MCFFCPCEGRCVHELVEDHIHSPGVVLPFWQERRGQPHDLVLEGEEGAETSRRKSGSRVALRSSNSRVGITMNVSTETGLLFAAELSGPLVGTTLAQTMLRSSLR